MLFYFLSESLCLIILDIEYLLFYIEYLLFYIFSSTKNF